MHGFVGIVAPVRRRDRSAAVIKVSFPHPGNVHEPDAFAAWQGRGAVHLCERDDAAFAMLLERAGPGTLADVADDDSAVATLGQLSRQLAVAAPPGLPRLSDLVAGWTAETDGHRTGPWTRCGNSTSPTRWCTATCTTPTCCPVIVNRGRRSTRRATSAIPPMTFSRLFTVHVYCSDRTQCGCLTSSARRPGWTGFERAAGPWSGPSDPQRGAVVTVIQVGWSGRRRSWPACWPNEAAGGTVLLPSSSRATCTKSLRNACLAGLDLDILLTAAVSTDHEGASETRPER